MYMIRRRIRTLIYVSKEAVKLNCWLLIQPDDIRDLNWNGAKYLTISYERTLLWL